MVWQPANQVPEQDRQKYEKEFDEYYKELETARERWVIFPCFPELFSLVKENWKKIEQRKEWNRNESKGSYLSFLMKKKMLSSSKECFFIKLKMKKNWGWREIRVKKFFSYKSKGMFSLHFIVSLTRNNCFLILIDSFQKQHPGKQPGEFDSMVSLQFFYL